MAETRRERFGPLLIPVGMAAAGPVAAVTGTSTALWLGVGVFVLATAVIAAIPSVRTIRAPRPGRGPGPTMAPR